MKNVTIAHIVEVKVSTAQIDLTRMDLFNLEDISISDLASFKPCVIHVIVRYDYLLEIFSL